MRTFKKDSLTGQGIMKMLDLLEYEGVIEREELYEEPESYVGTLWTYKHRNVAHEAPYTNEISIPDLVKNPDRNQIFVEELLNNFIFEEDLL